MNKKIIIGLLLVFMLQGCQSKYQKLIAEIEKQNTKGVEKFLEQNVDDITSEQFSLVYAKAIKSYSQDKEGLEVLQLLARVSAFPKKSYLSSLCQHRNILERMKYLMNRGDNLHRAWSTCKDNKEAYDYYHLEMEKIRELEDAKKENEIAIQKKTKIVKDSSFSSSLKIVVTDIEKSENIGDITARSARVERVNTGTFEFHGVFAISSERATLHIDQNTKFLIRDNHKYLEENEARDVFYKNISKPSSYYLLIVDKNRNVIQIKRYGSHIYHSSEELHKSMGD